MNQLLSACFSAWGDHCINEQVKRIAKHATKRIHYKHSRKLTKTSNNIVYPIEYSLSEENNTLIDCEFIENLNVYYEEINRICFKQTANPSTTHNIQPLELINIPQTSVSLKIRPPLVFDTSKFEVKRLYQENWLKLTKDNKKCSGFGYCKQD